MKYFIKEIVVLDPYEDVGDGGFGFGILSNPIFLRYFTSIGVTVKDIPIRAGASILWIVYAIMKSVDVLNSFSTFSLSFINDFTSGVTSIPLKLRIQITGKNCKKLYEKLIHTSINTKKPNYET